MPVNTEPLERKLKRNWQNFVKQLDWSGNINDQLNNFLVDQQKIIQSYIVKQFPAPNTLPVNLPIASITEKITHAIVSSGIASGINAREIARGLRQAGVHAAWHELETAARTAVVQAAWDDAWQEADDLIASGEIQMVWSAEQGPRTCPYCLSKHGMVVKDRTIYDHPRGRCTLVPRLTKPGAINPIKPLKRHPNWLAGRKPVWNSSALTDLGLTDLAQAFGDNLIHSMVSNKTLARELCLIVGEGKTIVDARKEIVKTIARDTPLDRATTILVNDLIRTRAQELFSQLKPLPKGLQLYRGGEYEDKHMASWTTNPKIAGMYGIRHKINTKADSLLVTPAKNVDAWGFYIGGDQEEYVVRGTYVNGYLLY